MSFELSESYLTGVRHLDDDHRELVARINAIDELERAKNNTALVGALLEFKKHFVEHFRREEADLKRVKYPKLNSHTKHHAETIVALERLIRSVECGEQNADSVAGRCFHELIAAVILQDMQFLNWLADHPELK